MSVQGDFVAATIPAGTYQSAAIDLKRKYDNLSVEIPEMDKCKLSLKVASTLAGTYYDLGVDASTDEETFNRAAIWLLGGWRYIKVVSSKPQTEERLIRVSGMAY